MKAKSYLIAALVAIGAFMTSAMPAQAGNHHHHHYYGKAYGYHRYYYQPRPVYYQPAGYYYYGRPYSYRPYYAPAPVQVGVSIRG